MNRNITKIKSFMTFCLAAGLTSGMLLTTQSCSENLDEGDFAIAKEQTISDYLAENAEYSQILALFERVSLGHKEGASSLRAVLSARGNYTIFAPTNDAINSYVADLLGSGKSISDLSDEEAELIAYSCIIDNGTEQAYESPDFPQEGGAFNKSDLNDRTITCEERTEEGSETPYYYINGKSQVVKTDVRLSNGYLHAVGSVIAPSNENVPDLIKEADNMNIMGALLHYTGWDEKLTDYMDVAYENAEHEQTIKLPNLATFAVAQHRYLGFTGLVETDDVFARYGVPSPQGFNVEDGGTLANWNDVLAAIQPIAEGAYGPDTTGGDLKNEDNPVNRFVAYHFLEGKMAHNKFVQHMCEYGYKYGDIMNPQQKEFSVDIWDYFTTVGKHRGLVKIMQEAVSHDLFANRTCKYDVEGSYEQTEVLHKGVQVMATNGENDNNARNGFYYPIDDLFMMDAKTADAMGNERIRFDITTILPELLNSGARNVTYMYFDDNNYFENITGCSDDTKLLYLTSAPVGGAGWCDYEGDEFMVLGVYDFTLKLPPVPKDGTYELRMGVSQNSLRGMCQIYFGDDAKSLLPVGLPYDMRNQYLDQDENVAWFNDTNLDEGTIIEKDKNMRNHGYMKGPKYFNRNDGTGNNTARDYSGNVRKIITTQNLKADKTYYIRFKSCLEDNASQFFSDYFEWCPRSIYNGVDPEDKW